MKHVLLYALCVGVVLCSHHTQCSEKQTPQSPLSPSDNTLSLSKQQFGSPMSPRETKLHLDAVSNYTNENQGLYPFDDNSQNSNSPSENEHLGKEFSAPRNPNRSYAPPSPSLNPNVRLALLLKMQEESGGRFCISKVPFSQHPQKNTPQPSLKKTH